MPRGKSTAKASKPSWKEDRVAWNKYWEREHDALYGSDPSFTVKKDQKIIKLQDTLPDAFFTTQIQDSLLHNAHVMQDELCTLQRDLSREVSKHYAEDDFVDRWTNICTKTDREKWILEGLFRTCEASPDFEDYRRFCPELTMNRLNAQSGRGFLDLMQKLTLQDIDIIPNDFQKIPNPVWEAMNDGHNDPKKKVNARRMDLQRTTFLTFFVWNTLLAFFGGREEYGLIKSGKSSISQELKDSLQNDERLTKILKNSQKEVKANNALAERGCRACGLTAERAGVRVLLACQKCNLIGRGVYYCNKQCQVQDWKNGRPPHKTICGNNAALKDAILSPGSQSSKGKSKAAVQSDGDSDNDSDDEDKPFWEEPKPGYIRSPALLHQMKFLEENRGVDYVFVRPEPHPDHGIALPHPMGKLMFTILLNRAVSEFAPVEVVRMYDMLLPAAEKAPGIGEVGLKKQLMREYNIDIDEWQPIVQKRADEELKKQGKTKEESQNELDEMYKGLVSSAKDLSL
ncbi:hypothetical protein BDP27DRAFT_987919 [Rhodocollybia butyracea]|uniref:MYND-type domain-containing protein n=1 Tax=Rhodocollybia butyracea TaxID=206335 RepID=A0A9P5PRH4_9AGAR|nr:hypothetical protein BDP27DRAFT_987919 [Rhodocollybia butyracea]